MSWPGAAIGLLAMILRLPMCSSSESMFMNRACRGGSLQSDARRARTGAPSDWFWSSNVDKGEGFIDRAINPVEFARADAIGRQQIHHIAQAAQENVALKIERVELGAKRGQIAGIGNPKLNGGNGARLTRVGDFGPAAERRERVHMIFRDGLDALR